MLRSQLNDSIFITCRGYKYDVELMLVLTVLMRDERNILRVPSQPAEDELRRDTVHEHLLLNFTFEISYLTLFRRE